MQCTRCGTPLPEGADYCPTCGNATSSHISSSGISPSEATVASSYEITPQNPYATPNPYTTPATAPPPPIHQRRLSTAKVALLIVLALLIVGAGGFLYFKAVPSSGQAQVHASPTAQAQQATDTPAASTPQNLYDQITRSVPVLDDPLQMNGTSNWMESTSADGKFSCAFTGGAYHASAQLPNTLMLCMAQATNFSDLAYQVQMTIVKGEFGGIVFRTDGSQSKYYSFLIDRTGNYKLITSVDNTGTHDQVVRKGTAALIKTGLNQLNTLAVVARGSSIYLYINHQYLTSASDSTYRAGQIGVFGGNYTESPADVAFTHVQVWNM